MIRDQPRQPHDIILIYLIDRNLFKAYSTSVRFHLCLSFPSPRVMFLSPCSTINANFPLLYQVVDYVIYQYSVIYCIDRHHSGFCLGSYPRRLTVSISVDQTQSIFSPRNSLSLWALFLPDCRPVCRLCLQSRGIRGAFAVDQSTRSLERFDRGRLRSLQRYDPGRSGDRWCFWLLVVYRSPGGSSRTDLLFFCSEHCQYLG